LRVGARAVVVIGEVGPIGKYRRFIHSYSQARTRTPCSVYQSTKVRGFGGRFTFRGPPHACKHNERLVRRNRKITVNIRQKSRGKLSRSIARKLSQSIPRTGEGVREGAGPGRLRGQATSSVPCRGPGRTVAAAGRSSRGSVRYCDMQSYRRPSRDMLHADSDFVVRDLLALLIREESAEPLKPNIARRDRLDARRPYLCNAKGAGCRPREHLTAVLPAADRRPAHDDKRVGAALWLQRC
jgi:hypothetical protein